MKRIFENEILLKDAAVFGDDKEHDYPYTEGNKSNNYVLAVFLTVDNM